MVAKANWGPRIKPTLMITYCLIIVTPLAGDPLPEYGNLHPPSVSIAAPLSEHTQPE